MGVLTRLLLSFISGMRGVFLKEFALKYCPQHNTGYQQPRVMCQKERMRTWDLLNRNNTKHSSLHSLSRSLYPFLPRPQPFPQEDLRATTQLCDILTNTIHFLSLSPSLSDLKVKDLGKKSRPLPVGEAKLRIVIPKHRFSWILISVGTFWAGKKLRIGI